MRQATATLAALALLAIAGGASGATPPPAPQASISFVKDFYSPADDMQFLDAVNDAACSKGRRGTRRLGSQNGVSPSNKPIPVVADQRIFLRSTGTYVALGPDRMIYQSRTQTKCVNITSFVPQAGHTYTLSQRNDVTRCEVKLRDNATGLEPATLTRHETPQACRAYS